MQYTVHRALAMIKTTKARIVKELSEDTPAWIRVAKGQEDNIKGVVVKDIQREIQSHYDRVTSLIENYIKLKSAVIQSNAGVRDGVEVYKVSVGEKKLTVAEIIEMHETVYGRAQKVGFKSALLAKMKIDYARAQAEFDDMQIRADEEISRYVQLVVGRKKDNEATDAETKSIIEATSKMLHEQKDPHLIDPLKLADKITALENEIEEFRMAADAVLSEQNALTTIELNLAEIK